eukprot:1162100-Pelagomonas_calceolata.AAC.14
MKDPGQAVRYLLGALRTTLAVVNIDDNGSLCCAEPLLLYASKACTVMGKTILTPQCYTQVPWQTQMFTIAMRKGPERGKLVDKDKEAQKQHDFAELKGVFNSSLSSFNP